MSGYTQKSFLISCVALYIRGAFLLHLIDTKEEYGRCRRKWAREWTGK